MNRKVKDGNLKINPKKLKTLPNEIITHGANEQLFQSISDEDGSHIMKINLASPTFATEAGLTSMSAHYFDNSMDMHS